MRKRNEFNAGGVLIILSVIAVALFTSGYMGGYARANHHDDAKTAQECIKGTSNDWNSVQELRKKINIEIDIIQKNMNIRNSDNKKKLGFMK